MVALTRPGQRLTLPLPFAGALGSGGAVALLILLMPASILERLVSASGIPAILAAAEPPLGITARIALCLILAGPIAAFAWLGLQLAAGDRPLDLSQWTRWLKRADVHPDGPPRPPLFANRDLGTPFLDVRAPAEAPAPGPIALTAPPERPLPADLDQPLAAFDPGSVPTVPMAPPELLKPLAPPPAPVAAPVRPQLIDPGDRFETFEITPVQRKVAAEPVRRPSVSLRAPAPSEAATGAAPAAQTEPAPVVAETTETTVHALLARLERGVALRDGAAPVAETPPAPEAVRTGTLQDTLGDLRRLAIGGR